VRRHAIDSVPQAAANARKATVITAPWLPIACSLIGVHDGSEPGEFVGDELAVVQARPEGGVGRRARLVLIQKHPMVTAANLVEGVAQHVEKILIGGQDMALKVELDDRLGALQGRHHRAHLAQFRFSQPSVARTCKHGRLETTARRADMGRGF